MLFGRGLPIKVREISHLQVGGGGGGMPQLIFWNARRNAWRIELYFCVAYGASLCTTFGKKKMSGSCQVAELF